MTPHNRIFYLFLLLLRKSSLSLYITDHVYTLVLQYYPRAHSPSTQLNPSPYFLCIQIYLTIMSQRSQAMRDWLRRQKIKHLHKEGGPVLPSKGTHLYFDWRRLHANPVQKAEDIHPGMQMWK
jgi:hypothetical protein